MARSAAKRANKPEGKDEILRAAASAFMERGFAATSIDDVAMLLGATKGRIYHYYRSKADLFFDVHDAALRMMLERVRPISESGLPPADKLRAMAYEQAMAIMADFAFCTVAVQGLEKHLVSSENVHQHRMMRRIIKLRDEYEDLYARVIEDGVRLGVFKDLPPRLAAKPALGALNWMTIWFEPQRNANAEQIELIAKTCADFVVDGLRRCSG
jgi:AcrR family transcriptional regulator